MLAAMDIAQLKDIVRRALQQKTFNLATAELKSRTVQRIAEDNLPGLIFRLSEAEEINSGNSNRIALQGIGVNYPFLGMASRLEFWVVDGEAAFSLEAKGDGSWNLGTGFPPFRNTVAAALALMGSSRLCLSSHDSGADCPRGLTFKCAVDIEALTAGLSKLIGVSKPTLYGTAVLSKQGSELMSITLKAPTIPCVNLGIATVNNVTLSLESDLLEPRRAAGKGRRTILPYLKLTAEIPLTANRQELPLPLQLIIAGGGSAIRLSANLAHGLEALENEIQGLAAMLKLQQSLKDLLPPGFQLSNLLTLEDLFLDFRDGGKLRLTGLDIRSRTPWTIFTGVSGQSLTLQEIALRLRVADPLGRKPMPWLEAGGRVSFGEGVLSVSAVYPDWSVRGYLEDGTRLKLSVLLNDLLGIKAGVPLLSVERLDFEISPKRFAFDLDIDAESDWAIPETMLSLRGLSCLVQGELQDGKIKRTPSGRIRGYFVLAGADLLVEAAFADTETNRGWSFEGKTENDSEIPVGKLIAELEEFLKASLPEGLKDLKGLTLKNLATKFNTASKKILFKCTGALSLGGAAAEIKIKIDFQPSAREATVTGSLQIGTASFQLVFTKEGFRASFSGAFDIHQLVKLLDKDGKVNVPPGLRIDLESAAFEYRTAEKAVVLLASSKKLGQVVFVSREQNGKRQHLFGVRINAGIGIKTLPLIGQVLGDSGGVSFPYLGLLSATADFKEYKLTPPEGSRSEFPAVMTVPGGVTLTGRIEVGTLKKEIELPLYRPQQAQSLNAAADDKLTDKVQWVAVGKTLGPLQLQRLGVQFLSKGEGGGNQSLIRLLLDAGVVASALQVNLYGLSLTFDPQNPLGAPPPPGLEGIFVAFESGPAMQIRAGLLGRDNEYSGEATFKFGDYGFSGFGLFTKGVYASLCIFGYLGIPFGHPAFFVKGLAAGFGFNREIVIPPLDEVNSFPLVQAARSGGRETQGLVERNRSFPVAFGNVWVAAGLQFSSYEMLSAYVLAVLSTGTQFEANLFGIGNLNIPKGAPAISVELALQATFAPSSGRLAFGGLLTRNSYLLIKEARLEGGFAISTWVNGPHQGDFVLTLGGYHPQFGTPAHYPRLAPLGINWQVSSALVMKGNFYFALIPSGMMFGGLLEAIFQSGDFTASFQAQADFLVRWQPFHYDAMAQITVNVSYTWTYIVTKTITVSVGASLHLYGPAFSGEAEIDLRFISFRIAFGAKKLSDHTAPAPICWKEFKDAFLLSQPEANGEPPMLTDHPADLKRSEVCQAHVARGMVKEIKGAQGVEGWVVSPGNLIIITSSKIPAKSAQFNGKNLPGEWNQGFGVGMVGVEDDQFKTTHRVTLQAVGQAATRKRMRSKRDGDQQTLKIACKPVVSNVSKALWSKDAPALSGGDAALIKGVLTGLQLAAITSPGASRDLPIRALKVATEIKGEATSLRSPAPTRAASRPPMAADEALTRLKQSITRAAAKRGAILEALHRHGFSTRTDARVEAFSRGEHDLLAVELGTLAQEASGEELKKQRQSQKRSRRR
jgi:Family of unknown function (DUF6603)